MFRLTETDLWDLAEEVDLEAKKATGRNGRGELPRSFFETCSAMANTNGGIILLGSLDSHGATRRTFYTLAGEVPEMEIAEKDERSIPPGSQLLPVSFPLLPASSPLLQISSVPLQISSVPLQAGSVPLPADLEMERLEKITRPIRESGKAPRDVMVRTILAVCNDDFLNLRILAELLGRPPSSMRIKYLNRMVNSVGGSGIAVAKDKQIFNA